MEYTLFYKKIKNPLDDRAIIEELVDAYSESSDFYSALTKRYSKNKTKYYDSIACDELHAALFNRWKRELFLITREQYEYAIKNKVLYDKDIYKLLNFLRTVPDVKTKKEADDILNKAFEDNELEEAMEKYRWDSLGAFSSWTHISERKINGYKTSTPKVEHRFYINAELRDVHKLSKIFMDKCYKYKLPFYFKIDEFGGRDDNIVIYSNTELLPNYFCILCEIEKEYPNIIKRCGKPTILSGVLRNWIGYGSEPIKLSGKSLIINTTSSGAKIVKNIFSSSSIVEAYIIFSLSKFLSIKPAVNSSFAFSFIIIQISELSAIFLPKFILHCFSSLPKSTSPGVSIKK